MRITLHDRQSFPVTSQRTITDNGFLQVPGRVARTGVQQYLASELELADRPPNSIVNVYRSPEEVFAPGSLSGYDNADVTVEHPDDLVDSTTFKAVSAGHAISSGRQDAEDSNFVVVDLLIKDQSAIDCINRGKAELSAGYTAEYDERPGIAPDGTPYEFVQTNITINHIALCDRARAGRRARLFDHNPMEKKPMPKVMLDNGGWLWDAIMWQVQNIGQMSVSGTQWWAKINLNGGTLIVQGGYAEVRDAEVTDRIPLNIALPHQLLHVSIVNRNFAQGYATYNPQVTVLSQDSTGFNFVHGQKERMIYWMAVGY